MKKLLTGLCALALSAGLLTACSESKTDRVGERPADRAPSASPSTVPPTASAGHDAAVDHDDAAGRHHHAEYEDQVTATAAGLSSRGPATRDTPAADSRRPEALPPDRDRRHSTRVDRRLDG